MPDASVAVPIEDTADESEQCEHEWLYRKAFPHDLLVCNLCPAQREADYDYP